MKIICKIVLIFIFVMIAFVLGVSIANANTVYKIEQKPSWTCNKILSNYRYDFYQCENDYILCIIYPGVNVSCMRKINEYQWKNGI